MYNMYDIHKERTLPRKRNYLNNKDILTQIHLSKNSYCTFINPAEDNMYDLILEDANKINIRTLKQAREDRAKRLSKESGEIIDPKTITNQDIIIRIMTTEHIPLVPKRKQKSQPKSQKESINDVLSLVDPDLSDDIIECDDNDCPDDVEMAPMKCGFPAFFHYRIDENKEPYIVGKSHWKGSLKNGEFNMHHGRVTDELAKMYMKLCERYATRSNWRGYTYNDEMRGQALVQLSQIGLQFNEFKSQNPFAYYTAVITNSFTRILNNEKKMQNIRDDILEENGLAPSLTRQMANDAEIEESRKNRVKQLNIP